MNKGTGEYIGIIQTLIDSNFSKADVK
jgi:hypothetical protein